MATYVSTNMEGFHKDISSKTKTRENVAPLWAGSFGEKDVEKAEVLKVLLLSFFIPSVFQASKISGKVQSHV